MQAGPDGTRGRPGLPHPPGCLSNMSLNRRDFIGLLAVSALQPGSGKAAAVSQPAPVRPAASRPRSRRIIWNDDGDDIRVVAFGLRRLWNARDRNTAPVTDRFESVKEFLDLRLAGLRDTPVDTISYCGVFTWPVWEMPRERIAALGEDPIAVVIDFARSCGKEFFFNLRMNDCHSSGPSWPGPSNWEPFRRDNLHLLQSTLSPEEVAKNYLPWIRGESSVYPLQSVLDRRGAGNRDVQSWSAFDYAKKEVREYFLGLVREACRRYDLDGIELDWLRMPFFFRFGQERMGVPLMNDFVREVAGIVRAVAEKKGRPIALSMRVPDSPERAMEIGLDVATWLQEGWLDILVVGNGLTPFSVSLAGWKQLAAPRDIPIYGCVTRNAQHMGDGAVFRGACHRLWAQEADGLYFFNHFIQSEYATMADAADGRQLRRRTKTYLVDQSLSGSQNGTIAPGPLPLVFTDSFGEVSIDLTVEILEDPNEATGVRMLTRWLGSDAAGRTRWSINGALVRMLQADAGNGLTYEATGLKPGRNTLRVTVRQASAEASQELVLEAVQLTLHRD